MLKGVDLSQWNRVTNYGELASQIDFALVRASYSDTIIDHVGRVHRAVLRNQGVLIGHYHYAEPGQSSPTVQARTFIDAVGTVFPGEIMALDAEVDAINLVNWCLAWAQTVLAVTERSPVIYINQDFLNRYDWSPLVDLKCLLWLASWVPSEPEFLPVKDFGVPIMRQWSDHGQLSGVEGAVDLDLFNGTPDDWRLIGRSDGHG